MRLPKLDTIIISIFFISIALWMVSKCGSKRSDYLERNINTSGQEERPVRRDTVVVQPTPQPAPQNAAPAPPTPATSPAQTLTTPAPAPVSMHPVNNPTNNTTTTAPSTTTAAPAASTGTKYTTLFVTIDGLKMRKDPGLKGPAIAKLDLYEKVEFLNQRTDWTQEISLGLEKVTEHWVKVRTSSGKVGWVFGAGVNYYKEKRKGVLE